MGQTELVVELERLCDVAPGTLSQSTVIEEIPGWSSLTFLGLIVVFDDLYGVTLKPRQVHNCSTIADLVSLATLLRV